MDKQEQNLPFGFKNRPVSTEKKAANWNAIQVAIEKRKRFPLTAIAASTILVIGLGVILFLNNTSKVQTIARQNKINRTDSTLSFVRHEVNTTGKERRIPLQDGSLIVLAGRSEITYTEPFSNKRNITLIGKAYFKVAKDTTRPFTVFSGAVSTTALGTEFTVTAFENTRRIIVRLYEGKVVVKPVEKGDRQLKHAVYLLPGQQFMYGSKGAEQIKGVKRTDATPEGVLLEELSHDNPSMPQDSEGSWYMFNNQSLAQVFDQLSAMFNVDIVYNKTDIENIYFTGKYNRSESLESILKEIATLHNLTITKKDNAYSISR